MCRPQRGDSGYDAAGLDYLIKTRKEYYVLRQRERTLKKGDRVAVLGRGIAVVRQADDKGVLVVLWNRHVLRIARVPPTTAEGIERYLGSGLVKGIGRFSRTATA
ncbi:MAG: hypothetical protein WB952_20900 [Terriglobales bacterium]